jgi:glycosyltransferase involved in cell wall biosynthesis
MAAAHQAAVERVTGELAEKRASHRVEFVRADRNRGKGAAIRLGWNRAAADASWLTFIDADGAIPAREYWRMASLLPATEADIVCACRIKMAGRTIDRTLFRHFQGRLFATFAEGTVPPRLLRHADRHEGVSCIDAAAHTAPPARRSLDARRGAAHPHASGRCARD